METPLLSDKNHYPDDEIIFSYIGGKKIIVEILIRIHSRKPS